jgi:ArsR family transcriptional regulator
MPTNTCQNVYILPKYPSTVHPGLDKERTQDYICTMVQVCNNEDAGVETGRCGADAKRALGDVLESGLFRALADPTRVAVLAALLEGDEATVSEIARCCPVDFSVVSRHLGVLREAGVVRSEKVGREVRYRPQVADLVDSLRALADSLEACCPREDRAAAIAERGAPKAPAAIEAREEDA